MADDARIGYMPTRVWGCPTTAMWTYRLGATRAKQLMFTGDTIDRKKAADWGLANESVPPDQLEAATMKLAHRIAGVPRSHLAMHKMVVNQVQKFADRWCTADDRPNRLVVTSRIEGYWDEALCGCDHVELGDH